jgi:hypothetical protein
MGERGMDREIMGNMWNIYWMAGSLNISYKSFNVRALAENFERKRSHIIRSAVSGLGSWAKSSFF